jgi:hypothetical protein
MKEEISPLYPQPEHHPIQSEEHVLLISFLNPKSVTSPYP